MSNPYFGLVESELLAMRTALLSRLTAYAAGSEFQAVTVGGKSFSRRVQSIAEIRDELLWINLALQETNPTTYGRRITRTAARFV